MSVTASTVCRSPSFHKSEQQRLPTQALMWKNSSMDALSAINKLQLYEERIWLGILENFLGSLCRVLTSNLNFKFECQAYIFWQKWTITAMAEEFIQNFNRNILLHTCTRQGAVYRLYIQRVQVDWPFAIKQPRSRLLDKL